jgi:hypothetical protein
MPVLRYVPAYPTDLMVAGEQLRSAAVSAPAPQTLVADDWVPGLVSPLVEDEGSYGALVGGYPVPTREVLCDPTVGMCSNANAVISTPCGALVPFMGGRALLNPFSQSTARFSITGSTVDSTDTQRSDCRVLVYRTPTGAFVGETVSDGGASWTMPVPDNNGPFMGVATYVAGGLAGATVTDLQVDHVG